MKKLSKEQSVLTAATQIFLQYGYRRATMGDIAAAADISRPALYLLFSSKEEIFEAVMKTLFAEQLTAIRSGLEDHESALDKIAFAFEVWCVKPYETIQTFPDAKDLLESGYLFAPATVSSAWSGFEEILTDMLKPMTQRTKHGISESARAHLLAAAAIGFKERASSSEELRQMIRALAALMLAHG